MIKTNSKKDQFYVHTEYKNQLNGYSKIYFDPFCRKRKISYHYTNNNENVDITFMTSIGQLNFFKWAIQYKIITYVLNNLNKIEDDMKTTNKKNKEKKLSSDSPVLIAEESSADDYDPIISSGVINSMKISPRKSSSVRYSSEAKRQQLSKSAYDCGIKKSCISINLDFD